MSERRKSAKERESQGVRVGVGGLVLLVAGVAIQAQILGIIGTFMAVIGAIMWGAGMLRRDS